MHTLHLIHFTHLSKFLWSNNKNNNNAVIAVCVAFADTHTHTRTADALGLFVCMHAYYAKFNFGAAAALSLCLSFSTLTRALSLSLTPFRLILLSSLPFYMEFLFAQKEWRVHCCFCFAYTHAHTHTCAHTDTQMHTTHSGSSTMYMIILRHFSFSSCSFFLQTPNYFFSSLLRIPFL